MHQCPLQTDKCHDKGEGLTTDDMSSAAARGNLQLVHKLLERGINVNEKNTFGRTPLQVSLLCGKAKKITLRIHFCLHKSQIILKSLIVLI